MITGQFFAQLLFFIIGLGEALWLFMHFELISAFEISSSSAPS